MSEKKRGVTVRQQIETDIQKAKTPEAMYAVKNKAEKKGLGAIFNARVEKDFQGTVVKINEKNIKASSEVTKLGGSPAIVAEITAGAVTQVQSLEEQTQQNINTAVEKNEGGTRFGAAYTAPTMSATAAAFDQQHMDAAAAGQTPVPGATSTLTSGPTNPGAGPGVMGDDLGEPEPGSAEETTTTPEAAPDLEQARRDYFAAHQAFMDKRGGGIRNGIKNYFKDTINFGDVKDKEVREKLETTQRIYNEALVTRGNQMIADKKAEFDKLLHSKQKKGKRVMELAAELEKYKVDVVFKTLVIDEKQMLIDQQKEQLPSKARATLSKAMELYGGLSKRQKIAVGVVLGTGLAAGLAATSAIWATGSLGAGGAAVGATLAKMVTGKAIATRLGTMAIGQTFGQSVGQEVASLKNKIGNKLGFFETGAKNAEENFQKTQKSWEDEPFDIRALGALQKKYDAKLATEASNHAWKVRTDLIAGFGGGMALGMLSSNFLGHTIDNLGHNHHVHHGGLNHKTSSAQPKTFDTQNSPFNQRMATEVTPKNIADIQHPETHATTTTETDHPKVNASETNVKTGTTPPTTEVAHPKFSSDSLVRQGEGVSHALKRQLENNPDLAKTLGYAGTSEEKLNALVKILKDTGLEHKAVNDLNSSFELKAEGGHAVVNESHITQNTGTHTAPYDWNKHAPFTPGRSTLIIPGNQPPDVTVTTETHVDNTGVTNTEIHDGLHDDNTTYVPEHTDAPNTTDDVYYSPEHNTGGHSTSTEHQGSTETDHGSHTKHWWRTHQDDVTASNKDGGWHETAPRGWDDHGNGHHSGHEPSHYRYPKLPATEVGVLANTQLTDKFADHAFLDSHVNDPAYPLYKTINQLINDGHEIVKGEHISVYLNRVNHGNFLAKLAEVDPKRYLWLKENSFI